MGWRCAPGAADWLTQGPVTADTDQSAGQQPLPGRSRAGLRPICDFGCTPNQPGFKANLVRLL